MFDFTRAMKRLIDDIADNCDELSHIRSNRLVVSGTPVKNGAQTGLVAQLLPMKYEGGKRSYCEWVRGRKIRYEMDRLEFKGREMLYVIYFLFPRFQNLSFQEKIETVFHELYHISPAFDGAVRRMHPRYDLHGPSIEKYDAYVRSLARKYLRQTKNPALMSFLKKSYRELNRRHQGVFIPRLPEPKATVSLVSLVNV